MPIGLAQCRNLEILHLGKKYVDKDKDKDKNDREQEKSEIK